jgi:hypothetical protein
MLYVVNVVVCCKLLYVTTHTTFTTFNTTFNTTFTTFRTTFTTTHIQHLQHVTCRYDIKDIL